MTDRYKRGDAITFIVKHKPFIDIGLPPTAQEYRDACCITWAIYDTSNLENLIDSGEMKRVPNRPGWYFARYQTIRNMEIGLYTVVFTTVTSIDGKDYTTRAIKEITILDDGVV
jgi:hypothetical protein